MMVIFSTWICIWFNIRIICSCLPTDFSPEDTIEDEGVEIDDGEDSYMVEDLSMKSSKPVENNENVPSRWTIYEDINSLFPIPLPRSMFWFYF